MSLLPCGFCGQRPKEKLSTLFWGWRLADNTRVGYRQQLCLQCYCQNVLTICDEPEPGELRCAGCHTVIGDDLDAVYATSYVPSRGRDDLQIALCSVCAVEVRLRAQRGARFLPDRETSVDGQAPARQLNTSVEAWNALGLQRISE